MEDHIADGDDRLNEWSLRNSHLTMFPNPSSLMWEILQSKKMKIISYADTAFRCAVIYPQWHLSGMEASNLAHILNLTDHSHFPP